MHSSLKRGVIKGSLPILLAAAVIIGCSGDSPHGLVRQLGTTPLDPRIANDEVDWGRVVAEIGIDSIAYQEEECGVAVRYSLVLNHAGVGRWIGQQSAVLPGEWNIAVSQLAFVRLADFIRAEELENLSSDEPPDAIDGTCYRLRAWEKGREDPLEWRGTDYPGGDQRLWLLRSAVGGMLLRASRTLAR